MVLNFIEYILAERSEDASFVRMQSKRGWLGNFNFFNCQSFDYASPKPKACGSAQIEDIYGMIVGGVGVGNGVPVGVGERVAVAVERGVRVGLGVPVGVDVLVGVSDGASTRVGVISASSGYNSRIAEYQSRLLVSANSLKRAPR